MLMTMIPPFLGRTVSCPTPPVMVGVGIPLAWVGADAGVWPQLEAAPGLLEGPQGYGFAGLSVHGDGGATARELGGDGHPYDRVLPVTRAICPSSALMPSPLSQR
jgi:hypothetical protein